MARSPLQVDRRTRRASNISLALMVAATGGHLAQLHRLADRIDIAAGDRVWVTFDGPQSRSLLADEEVVFVPYVAPRDLKTAMRNGRPAGRLMRDRRPTAVVSTGSAIAMSFLPLARAFKIPALYIESAARSDGPSLTGRMLQRVPGVALCTQYETWADERWTYVGSVFDDYEAVAPVGRRELRRVVVTLGTIEGFGFRRLVERLLEVLPSGVEVTWQVGDTDVADLPIDGIGTMPAAELDRRMRDADVVIAHAGIGSSIAAMEAGHVPLLVPRSLRHGEHVDDHQYQIAKELAHRGLAWTLEPEGITLDALKALTGLGVRRTSSAPPIATGLMGVADEAGHLHRRRDVRSARGRA